MSHLELRECLNCISDVLLARPAPLREFDQIYMRTGDMLVHAEHVAHWFDDRDVVFVGDGDGIAMTVMHLLERGQLHNGPRTSHVLDFDERIVNTINRFARQYGLKDKLSAELYNVARPVPRSHCGAYSAFHTNPPFGASNGGHSMNAFIQRCIECSCDDIHGCVVAADDASFEWTRVVLSEVERFVLGQGFMVSELRPACHQYHLDDAPNLTSCSLLVQRVPGSPAAASASGPLPESVIGHFYGKDQPLQTEYIRDLTGGGRLPSRDHKIRPFANGVANA